MLFSYPVYYVYGVLIMKLLIPPEPKQLKKQFINQMKNSFPVIKVTKPKASRAKSAEVYILGLHYKDKK